MVRVAGTPLWVQVMPGEGRSAAATPAAAAKMTAAVLPHSRSAALGVSGVVFQLGGAAPASGRIRVRLDYSAFAQAYGGNYGTRLRLVELPACALTTPRRAGCRQETPLRSVQDVKADTVSAVVAPGARLAPGWCSRRPSTTGKDGGAAGAYPPTKLSPAGTWSEAGDSGAFTLLLPDHGPARAGRPGPVGDARLRLAGR